MSGQHILVVQPFDPEDDTDRFDVEHPADCPTVARWEGPDGEDVMDYDCAVAYHLADDGVDTFFAHADDPEPTDLARVAEGRHAIEAWSQVHPAGPWGSAEWSGGLRLVEQPQERAS